MDCALSAAAAGGPAATPDASGAASLCEQGRRFTELLNAPGEPGAVASPVADTYVPAAEPLPTGGITLTDAIERVRSLTLPEAHTQPPTPAEVDASNDPTVNVEPGADLANVMRQSVAWQTELVRMSMLGDMVSSMNQGVRTLFQQQG